MPTIQGPAIDLGEVTIEDKQEISNQALARLTGAAKTDKPPLTIRQELDAQHDHKKALAASGQMSPLSAKRFYEKALHFVNFAGDILLSQVDAELMNKFHAELCQQIKAGKRTTGGAKDLMVSAKHLLNTAKENDYLKDLPKNLTKQKSPLLKFHAPSSKTKGEIRLTGMKAWICSPRSQERLRTV